MEQCKDEAMTSKTVFVTVGTTKFDNLIITVLNPIVLEVKHVILLFKFFFFIIMIGYLFYII